ncbi:Nif3-like dinuclear metal center hexameric protein [[Clostridium] colinum]|uniref:Nif3-like dinuclear metal center hexameric protein n=1 Tax=[Clostridium] colinum TaxID=36835 RepID=UPI002023F33E|nr:Nif3-like dinuclear metal center hexameric protein [[Clostridium] colinum]
MSVKCSDIINIMEEYANPNLAEEWDNVGLMVGDENKTINKILVALDVDDKIIDEAIEKKCDMIITHHPFIFKGIKSIKASDITGKRIIKLIKNNICVFSAHTNLDIAINGTNDTLAKLLNLEKIVNLFEKDNSVVGLGRVGELPETMPFIDLIERVKKALNLNNLVVSGSLDTPVKKVAICTGAGGEVDFMFQAISKGCNVYITGDIKYHNSQVANDLGLCLIDATHYASEAIIIPVICDYINSCSRRLNMNIEGIASTINGQTLNIV